MACGGVRNRIFESELYGSTLVWSAADWHVRESSIDSDHERLVLNDAAEVSAPSESILAIEFSPFDHPEARYRALSAAFRDVMARPDGEHRSVHDPSASALRAEGVTNRNGITYLWQIDCPNFEGSNPGESTHVVVLFHEAREDARGRRDAARDVVESLRRATPNWEQCHDTGVIEVVSGIFDLVHDPVTVTLTFANVDDKDAQLEFSRLFLLEEGAGANEYPADAPGTVVPIPQETPENPETVIEIKFTVPDPALIDHVIYRQETRDIILARYSGDVGASGRPRINPGG